MEFFFILFIGLLVFIESKLYKTFFTPFAIIATVYAILIGVNNFFAIHFGYFEVSTQSITYILFFLILIFLISILFYLFMKRKSSLIQENAKCYFDGVIWRNRKIIKALFIFGLIAKYISLMQVVMIYGLANTKGNDFGLFAHLGDIGVVLMPFMMVYYLWERKKRYLLVILLMFVNLLLFKGKYGIIIAFIHLIVLYAFIKDIKIKKTIKIGVILAVVGVLMFIIVYAVNPTIERGYFDQQLFMEDLYFSVQHFLLYLISPITATNHFFFHAPPQGENIQILFTVPINVLKALAGSNDYVNPINYDFVLISDVYTTNVSGLFAESVYRSNAVIAFLYVGAFFAITYYFFIKTRYRGEMIGLTALLLAVVSMMFFVNLLTVSGIVLRVGTLWILELMIKNNFFLRSNKRYRQHSKNRRYNYALSERRII